MDARVPTFAMKGLDRIDADGPRAVSALDGNHKLVVLMCYSQDDVMLSELACYFVPNTSRRFNLYRLAGSPRGFDGPYQSLEVSARFCHVDSKVLGAS
jgi:hypothetical protein